MKTINYTNLMKPIAEEKAQAIAKEEKVKGIILVGSVAKGEATKTSDIDLFCIGNLEYKRQKETLKGIVCDISFVPTSFFQNVFEESNFLQKGVRIEFLRHGIVLYDPEEILRKIKEKAQVTSWSEKDLQTARKSALSAIRKLREIGQKYDLTEKIVATRKVSEIAGAYVAMKNGELVFYPPMYMLDSLSKTNFLPIYQKVNNLLHVANDDAEKVTARVEMQIQKLWKRYSNKNLLQQKTRGLSSGMQTEIKNARNCVGKGKIKGAILQARFAYLLYSVVKLWEAWENEWKRKEVLWATYGLGTIEGRIALHEELQKIGGNLFEEYCSILGLKTARLSKNKITNLVKKCERQVKTI